MSRDILTNKWVLSGIGFLIILSGLCYLYYQWTIAPYRKDAAELDEMIRQSESQRTAPTAKSTERAADASMESTTPTTEKSVNGNTAEVENSTEAETQQTDTSTTTAESKDVPMSPHGFGPYPEVPNDFPENVDWDDYANDLPIYELMTRVQIKLWNQGQRAVGIFKEGGLLYPTIQGSIYIRWGDNGKDIVDFSGHPDDISDEIEDQLWEGIIPSGFKILNYDESGIDPYKFLNLR